MPETAKRVFVLTTPHPVSQETVMWIREHWESISKGTEIEGSKILILPPGMNLYELNGEGLPMVAVDSEGNFVFPSEANDA